MPPRLAPPVSRSPRASTAPSPTPARSSPRSWRRAPGKSGPAVAPANRHPAGSESHSSGRPLRCPRLSPNRYPPPGRLRRCVGRRFHGGACWLPPLRGWVRLRAPLRFWAVTTPNPQRRPRPPSRRQAHRSRAAWNLQQRRLLFRPRPRAGRLPQHPVKPPCLPLPPRSRPRRAPPAREKRPLWQRPRPRRLHRRRRSPLPRPSRQPQPRHRLPRRLRRRRQPRSLQPRRRARQPPPLHPRRSSTPLRPRPPR